MTESGEFKIHPDLLAQAIKRHRTPAELLFNRLPIVRTLYCSVEDVAGLTLVVETQEWLSQQKITVMAHPYMSMGYCYLVPGRPPAPPDLGPEWHPDLMDIEANAAYWSAE